VISSSPTDLQPVLDAVAQSAARLCAGNDAAIYRIDGDFLQPVATTGPLGAHPIPVTRTTVTGRAVVDRETVHVDDIMSRLDTDFPDAKPLQAQIGFRTILATPLLREGTPIGAILIRRTEVRPFSEKQIELFKTFADQSVIAIENVRLFNETREALEQQKASAEVLGAISSSIADTKPVFDKILESCERLFAGKQVGINLVGEDGQIRIGAYHGPGREELERVAPFPPGDTSGSGAAIAHRRVIHYPDAQNGAEVPAVTKRGCTAIGVKSVIFSPMLWEGRGIGVIFVGREFTGPYSEKEIALLGTFADQAVIAIENVRLFNELQARTADLSRSVEELKALGEVGAAVSSTLDLDTVLTTILTHANKLAGTQAGQIFDYDEATEELRLRSTFGYTQDIDEALRRNPIRKGEGVTGQAVAKRQPVQVADIAADDAYESSVRDLIIESGFRALLAVPLIREDQVMGALVIARKRPGEFPQQVVDLLSTFASQSALAIQNARLFLEIEQKSHELQIASQHKSQFLANMSHELRTPLNAILGYTELIVDQIYGKVPEKIRDVLERVQKSGRHLLGLINDVLDLSKIEAGQLTLSLSDYSFQDAVQSVVASVESLARGKGLQLTVKVAPKLPVGRADERRIVQVLLNLAGNAIKFTDAGEVKIRVNAVDDAFVVSVSDTGPGIPETQHERIFEEFQQVDGSSTRTKGGTGLGLAIAKKIIELHGGRIWVESVVGKGSTFTFSLPVRTEIREVVQ
jgi:signal transduction histidine kinase